MSEKIKRGSFWINCIGHIYEVKRVDKNMVYAQGYSRQGTPNDHIEHASVKDFLSVSVPCAVAKIQYFDADGNLMYHTVEVLEEK